MTRRALRCLVAPGVPASGALANARVSMSGAVEPSAHDRERALATQRRHQRQQQLEQCSSHYQRGAMLPEKQHQSRRADDSTARSQAGRDQ